MTNSATWRGDSVTVTDARTGAVLHREPVPSAVATDEVIRLRRLLLEVASLGIVTDEDRVGPSTPGHQWVEMPVALWDRIEGEVARG